MVLDSSYEKWQINEASYSLSNWADLIIQQLEDVGSIALGDLAGFKKALRDFDIQMGFAELCPECSGDGGFPAHEDEGATKCLKCNGNGVIPLPTFKKLHTCLLCDKYSPDGQPHKACMDYEAMKADTGIPDLEG